MHIILESVLMPSTQNYQNQSMLVETTAAKIGSFFETQCICNQRAIDRARSYDASAAARPAQDIDTLMKT